LLLELQDGRQGARALVLAQRTLEVCVNRAAPEPQLAPFVRAAEALGVAVPAYAAAFESEEELKAWPQWTHWAHQCP
jgi:hypothetical protein